MIEKWGTTFWDAHEQRNLLQLNHIAPQQDKKKAYRALTLINLILLPLFTIWAIGEQTGISIFICTFLIAIQYWALRYFFSRRTAPQFWIARIFELAVLSIGASLVFTLQFQQSWNLKMVLYLTLPLALLSLFVTGYLYYCRHYFKTANFFKNIRNLYHGPIFTGSIKKSYLQYYYTAIFLSTLSLSLVLTFFIYRASYLQETESIQKYELELFERGLINHENEERAYFYSLQNDANSELNDLADYRINQCKGVYLGNITLATFNGKGRVHQPYTFFPSRYQIRPNTPIFNAKMYNLTAEEQSESWRYLSGRILKQTPNLSFNNCSADAAIANTASPAYLSSERASFWSPAMLFLLLFLLLIVILAAAGNAMIRLIIRQLFIIRAPRNFQFDKKTFPENIGKLKAILDRDDKKSFYLVTLPLPFRQILKEFDSEDYCKVSWPDLSYRDLPTGKLYPEIRQKPLVITDFELPDKQMDMGLIKRLKQMVEDGEFVTIVSKYDPLDLLLQAKERPNKEAGFEHNNLAGLLAEFDTYYFPLTADILQSYQWKEQQEQLFMKERSIYYELWNSLTPEERYVLLDLTKDGLVNTQNLPVIHRLFKKGLITGRDNFKKQGQKFITSLQVFDNHFRQFIDKLAETEDLKELEEEINATGTWRRYRTPLLVTLTGILIFIFVTQQETYGEIVGILASVGASLPLLLKLLSTVVTKNKTTDTAS